MPIVSIQMTRSVLSIHPAFLGLSFLGFVILLEFVRSLGGYLAEFLIMPLVLAFSFTMTLWTLALYEESAAKGQVVKGRLKFAVFGGFFISLAGFLLSAGLAAWLPSTARIPVQYTFMALVVVFYLGAIWLSAYALIRAEQGKRHVVPLAVIGTALLIFYLPLGIWILKARLDRLLRLPSR
jgi:hypothetical protein